VTDLCGKAFRALMKCWRRGALQGVSMPERASLPPSARADLPAPSPELTMIGALMRAHLRTLPAKKRRAFLANLMEVFEEYEGSSNVIRIRGREHDAEVTRARREAVAWARAMMGAFWLLDADAAP
jgi:hypothetical protein